MSKIFISYRREDTRHVAGRLYDRLTAAFGEGSVFRDVYSIPGGAHFPTWIDEAVSSAEAVVVLIGERWLEEDGEGRRRLENADDWVRLEIATALERRKPVLPVLVDDARMPKDTELPGPLRDLAHHHGVELTDADFDSGLERLVRLLRERVTKNGFGAGYFRRLGTFHVHVDGDDPSLIDRVVEDLGPDFPSKVNRVVGETLRGPQWHDHDFVETYRHHTPGSTDKEAFSAFSTTLLGTGPKLTPEAVDTLKRIISVVTRKPGFVVELERVVATIDEGGVWSEAELLADPPDLWKLSEECDSPRLITYPIEIHHAIDVPKDGLDPSELKELLPRGPNVGAWSLFEKKAVWAYRSNQFADWSDYEHYAKDGDAQLRAFLRRLRDRGIEATLRTVVEQVLGIWRRVDEPRRKDFKSVPDLAQWEMKCPEFWVIASNFLGDKSPDVKNAMVHNLKRDVTYTYFVRRYADVFRLNVLRRELEDELYRTPGVSLEEAQGIVSRQIRGVLVSKIDSSLKSLLSSDYFICPREGNGVGIEGYQLQPRAMGGQRMEESQLQAVIAGLSPLLEQRIEGFYLSVPQEPWRKYDLPERYALVCTDLDSSGVGGGIDAWQRVLSVYDRIVAREVSMFRYGDVVRPVRNGYLFVFRSVKDAAEFAKRLQSTVNWHNEDAGGDGPHERLPLHVVSLEYGAATRVLRAHGDDYIGSAVDRCILRLDRCKGAEAGGAGSVIAMSESFALTYREEIGEAAFGDRAKATPDGWTMLL